MPRHSNKLQKWISKSEQEKIESLITSLERRYPFEVVVAFSDSPAIVPMAAARMIACLAVIADLIAETFWLPIPAGVFGLVVLFFLFAPAGHWQGLLPFRILSRRSERRDSIEVQAELCFSELGLARTKERNALLLFFNLHERIFTIRPDRTLQNEWPQLNIEELVTELKTNLEKTKAPSTAAAQSIERLLTLAQARWPDHSEKHLTENELPNAVCWWMPR
ncbi:hypothetical protein EBR21_08195 [bacterium]|nr:hypothetical protein [bacterium]